MATETGPLQLSLFDERDLARIQAQGRRKHAPLRGAAAIGMAVGAVVNNRKVGKHFAIEIGDNGARSHVFLCMLAYHVEWHLRDALAPLLFHDTELAAARAERSSPVSSTEPSDAAKAKKATKRSADGHRVMCFADLVDHLGTLTCNTMRLSLRGTHRFTLYSTPPIAGGRLQVAPT